MKNAKLRLETCLSPAMYSKHANDENIVVVVDILRATSSICTALHNGVKRIIPVATVEEAKVKKEEGFIVASERVITSYSIHYTKLYEAGSSYLPSLRLFRSQMYKRILP